MIAYGDGRHPVSGPLPGFARDNHGLAYFTYTAHPHDHGTWAASKDPEICTRMYTALALHSGFIGVNWMDFSTDDLHGPHRVGSA
ncbi:hypothetical protein ABZW49_31105 [Nonomuraea wenchangensis]